MRPRAITNRPYDGARSVLRAIANRPYATTVVMRKRDGHTMARCCGVCGWFARLCCRGGLQPPVGLTRCMRTVLRAIANRPYATTVVMRKRDGHTMARCCGVCRWFAHLCCRGALHAPAGDCKSPPPHSLAHLFNTPMQYCLNII